MVQSFIDSAVLFIFNKSDFVSVCFLVGLLSTLQDIDLRVPTGPRFLATSLINDDGDNDVNDDDIIIPC